MSTIIETGLGKDSSKSNVVAMEALEKLSFFGSTSLLLAAWWGKGSAFESEVEENASGEEDAVFLEAVSWQAKCEPQVEQAMVECLQFKQV